MKFTYSSGATPLPGYTIKRAIHRGGFGEVYYGVSEGGKEVALKLLMENRDVELRGIQQCLNLHHPHLVSLFDVRHDPDGDAWVIMEYIEGATLSEEMARHPNGLPLEQVQRWLKGIVEGVEFLHQSGIIHRDMKPANLFDHLGQIKVGDVGLSKLMTPTRRSAHTQSVGTVYYMAPEIAQGKYGKEVDTYAIGIIAYEMLTGKVPFDGQTTAEILMKHLTAEPDLTNIPQEYRSVIQQALEKDPAKRLSNLRAFLVTEQPATSPSAKSASDSWSTAQTVETPTQPYCKPKGKCGDRPFAKRKKHKSCCGPPKGLKKAGLILGIIFLVMTINRGGATVSTVLSPASGFSLIRLMLIVLGLVICFFVFKLTKEGLFWVAGVETEPPPAPQIRPPRRVPNPPVVKQASHANGLIDVNTPRQISLQDRIGQVCYSWLIAIPVTTIFSAFCLYFSPEAFSSVFRSDPDPGVVVLFAGTIFIASSLLMLTAKILEGQQWDTISRRLLFAVVGIVTGLLVHHFSDFLVTDLQTTDVVDGMVDFINHKPLIDRSTALGLQGATHPTALGYAAFFGSLFFITSWWKWSDSLRASRVNPGVMFWCGFLAWWLSKIVAFPSGWGMVISFGIACVVQTSAVWIAHDKRKSLVNQH